MNFKKECRLPWPHICEKGVNFKPEPWFNLIKSETLIDFFPFVEYLPYLNVEEQAFYKEDAMKVLN